MMKSGCVLLCKLCGSSAPLRKSHIIPRFVANWMKGSSPIPYLRSANDVDKRRQDLPVMELLCDDCENRFSAWEGKFAHDIFHPSAAGETVFRYGPWLVKFAASLTWRAIQIRHFYRINESPAVSSMVDEMELHLSRFLLGLEKHVGSYTQHIYPVGELDAPIRPGSPMLNRYLARAVQIDFLRNDDLSEMVVYVKLPMFMFLSIGESKHREWLEKSRIKKSGVLHPRDYVLDMGILDYIVGQSDRLMEVLDSMSPKSKAAVDKAILNAIEKEPNKVANSKSMQAMRADYEFYGEEAVVYRD